MACEHFRDNDVDVAVVEVGLGGRRDCTNVFHPATVTVVTNVQKDHTNVLGRTIAAIAREKAAVIKPGTLALTAATRDGLRVIRDQCHRTGSPLWQPSVPAELSVRPVNGGRLRVCTPLRSLNELEPGMRGAHQAPNVMLAAERLTRFAHRTRRSGSTKAPSRGA